MPEGDRQLPDWDEVDRLAEEFGDSFYVLHEAQLRANVMEFQSEFGGRYPATDVAYPYKTNHLPDICRTLAGLGVRAEIGSDMELWLAHELGVDRTALIFNGPNRSKGCLRKVMHDGGTVIVDSVRDLRIVEELAKDSPEREFSLGLRVNFPLGGRTLVVDTPQKNSARTGGYGVGRLEFTGTRQVADPDTFDEPAAIRSHERFEGDLGEFTVGRHHEFFDPFEALVT